MVAQFFNCIFVHFIQNAKEKIQMNEKEKIVIENIKKLLEEQNKQKKRLM